jgi:hypothetical protein
MKALEMMSSLGHGFLHTQNILHYRGAHGAHDTRPITRISREPMPLAEVAQASPAPSGGPGTSLRFGLTRDGGGGGPVATEDGKTGRQDFWPDVPRRHWLPHPPRTDPGAEPGQEHGLPDPGRPAQAEVAAAVAASRAGPPGHPRSGNRRRPQRGN